MPNNGCGCCLTSKDLTVIEDRHHRQQYDALCAFLNGCQ